MVLDNVADGSSLIVKTSSALYTEVLRHRDLNALDVVAVPKGFDKRIGKAERQHIVYCSLAKIMVNTEDVSFVEGRKQNLVQFLRRRQIMPEWFLYDDLRAFAAIRFGQMPDDGFEQRRRNCQVMRWTFRVFEFFPKRSEG